MVRLLAVVRHGLAVHAAANGERRSNDAVQQI